MPTKRLFVLFVVFIAAMASDRLSKSWALSALSAARSGAAAPMFSLGLHYNRGISFSLLEPYPHLSLLTAAAALAALGLLCLRSRTLALSPGMALLWAGTLGNLADRALYGHVIDWFYVGVYVNLADAWLCAGAALLLLRRITDKKDHERELP